MANDFLTGWWIDITDDLTTHLAQLSTDGNTLILLGSCGWFCDNNGITINAALDKCTTNGIKAILGFTTGWANLGELTTTVGYVKNHAALYGYYIADEPGDTGKTPEQILAIHDAVVASDTSHPICASFNMLYGVTNWNTTARPYYESIDFMSMHSYPFAPYNEEFSDTTSTQLYDAWALLLSESSTYSKLEPIATCQGIGNNSPDTINYRRPSIAEMRYQAFTAIVQGVKKVLFWFYTGWGDQDATMISQVATIIGQIQSIGAEMNAGTTSAPAISIDLSSSVAYRYGVSGDSHALLVVNIAGKATATGSTINPVISLPTGTNAASVTVLGESRTINIADGDITDTFDPFEVHLYQWENTEMGGEVAIKRPDGISIEMDIGMGVRVFKTITIPTEENELVWGAEWGLPWPEAS